jgi:hypothetical protein
MKLWPFLRNRMLRTLISLFIAVQLLNICIDPIDHFTGAQEISINEIESCIEFVLEVVMGNDNAVKESDEADDSSDKQAVTIVLFLSIDRQLLSVGTSQIKQSKISEHYFSNFSSLAQPINSPPPKA